MKPSIARPTHCSFSHPLRAFGTLLAALLVAAAPAAAQETPVDFKVAFIGDQGLGSDAEAVLALIRSEGADAVIHQGDFDYQDDPAAWEAMIDGILGPDFPYFASVGNHDTSAFYGAGGYQEVLADRMARLGVPWTGDLGVQSFHRRRRRRPRPLHTRRARGRRLHLEDLELAQEHDRHAGRGEGQRDGLGRLRGIPSGRRHHRDRTRALLFAHTPALEHGAANRRQHGGTAGPARGRS
jgi:hypothetical protein